MKKTRKLVPAIALLLISALLLSTASYAWFSMNTQVTATGLTVSAKSDTVFLVINTGSTFDAAGTAISATSLAAADTLYPCAHGTIVAKEGTQSEIELAADMSDATKWYRANAATNNASTAKGATAVAITDLTEYIASEEFSIGINNKSGEASASNLRVTSVSLPANAGIVLVLVCGTNVFEYKNSATDLADVLADTVTTGGQLVKAYYYIDGENDNVYTDNSAALTGAVSFTVDCN